MRSNGWIVYLCGGLVLVAAILAILISWIIPSPAHADSRLYPTLGMRYRVEHAEAPKLYGEGGVAVSFGPIAPAARVLVPLNRNASVGFDVSVQWRLR